MFLTCDWRFLDSCSAYLFLDSCGAHLNDIFDWLNCFTAFSLYCSIVKFYFWKPWLSNLMSLNYLVIFSCIFSETQECNITADFSEITPFTQELNFIMGANFLQNHRTTESYGCVAPSRLDPASSAESTWIISDSFLYAWSSFSSGMHGF